MSLSRPGLRQEEAGLRRGGSEEQGRGEWSGPVGGLDVDQSAGALTEGGGGDLDNVALLGLGEGGLLRPRLGGLLEGEVGFGERITSFWMVEHHGLEDGHADLLKAGAIEDLGARGGVGDVEAMAFGDLHLCARDVQPKVGERLHCVGERAQLVAKAHC